ncbi:N,N-dimethylformamidase beta subunit [Delftia tsuruhatensis]|uniref:N,N-dimethylformamidase beta subunit family domain-containing protein n=1 Tax=Delftia tsuruhatensis TaxID=180282 RepID=UPI001E7B75F8|nr:N,N-dimethylformamidase beta subunit family domain-containing protein [Delftia tsuruhatensis]CAB5695801.1 N,N-dimethylformamidase beta subunit [Delftia tsuruhatensis]CAC9678268.1 N,N-dimethylformamidase beta subunit [Delftia tsuruhatensis]
MNSITGYSDKISVAAGETIAFKVSARPARPYGARLVRIIHGDMNPQGPGYKEEHIPSSIERTYDGREQRIHCGSFAWVGGNRHVARLGAMTLQAIVWPTQPGGRAQTVMCLWNPQTQHGVRLDINARGELEAVLAGAGGTEILASGKPLLAREWYSVALSIDAEQGTVTLRQIPHRVYARVDDAACVQQRMAAPALDAQTLLGFAATPALADGRVVGRALMNGKIDRPRLSARALDEAGIRALEDPCFAGMRTHGVVGVWDFSRRMESETIEDISGNQLHGRTVNLPVRAMKGANWTGEEMNWRHAPREYGAMHFHDDAVHDAGWDTDFSLTVPESLPSGLYAAHLRCGDDEEFIPFVVRPVPGRTRHRIAYLVPTASYMAYANEHMPTDAPLAQLLTDQVAILRKNDLFLGEQREYGNSCYDVHSDGAGVCYTSRLRPILNMRPKYRSWLGGRGSALWQFNADTHVIDWLEALGYGFDCLSDEDLHYQGEAALGDHDVLITSSHSEYWSKEMWDAVDAFRARGGRIMSMGGNTWYWRVAFNPVVPGVMEVRRNEDGTRAWAAEPGEYYHSFTGEYGGLWRRQGRAPQMIAGNGFIAQGFDDSSYFLRKEGSFDPRARFIFEGIADDERIGDFGLVGNGAAGLELDHVDRLLGSPPNTLVLASSTGHSDIYQVVAEEILINYPGTGGTVSPLVKADLVFYETAAGGAVFSTGSIAWAGSLSHNGYDNNVSRITRNVLDRFLDRTPF